MEIVCSFHLDCIFAWSILNNQLFFARRILIKCFKVFCVTLYCPLQFCIQYRCVKLKVCTVSCFMQIKTMVRVRINRIKVWSKSRETTVQVRGFQLYYYYLNEEYVWLSAQKQRRVREYNKKNIFQVHWFHCVDDSFRWTVDTCIGTRREMTRFHEI